MFFSIRILVVFQKHLYLCSVVVKLLRFLGIRKGNNKRVVLVYKIKVLDFKISF